MRHEKEGHLTTDLTALAEARRHLLQEKHQPLLQHY